MDNIGQPVGTKVSLPINGTLIPGIIADANVMSEPRTFTGRNGQTRTQTAFRQAVLSLRINQETGAKYVTQTYENLQFVFAREGTVEGLDFVDGDQKVTVAALQARRAADFLAFQASRGTTVSALDLLPQD